jgi:hypothetical protein
MDVSRLHALGCQATVGLEEGLGKAYADFLRDSRQGTLCR